MWTDVIDMNAFYRSRLGQIACRILRHKVREIWPDAHGQTIVGLGYATPFLKQFNAEAERVVAAMPAHMGVTHWPRGKPSKVVLAYDESLPFPDNSVDKLLLAHSIENTEHLRQLMREAWRILAGNGKMVIIVPSRRGFWAKWDRTPFGGGRPYSKGQVHTLMRDTQFEPGLHTRALYMPPFKSNYLVHTSPAWERIGRKWFPQMGGVMLIEATKQVYAAATPLRTVKRKLVIVPSAVGASRKTTVND